MTLLSAATHRALRTVAQTAVSLAATATLIEEVDWRMLLSASLLAGLLSFGQSFANGLPEADL